MQNVFLGATQQFTANVSGTTNPAVTWSVNGITGGNSTVGTIDVNGLYRAPAILPSPATVSVRATSVASGTSSASATVTVTSDVVVSITAPAQNANVELGAAQQVTSSITSTGNGASQNVVWSVSGAGCSGAGCGTITTGGMFTAPRILPGTTGNNITVTATSVADASRSATLTLHITASFGFAISSPPGNTIDNATSFPFVATLTPVPPPPASNPSTTVSWSVTGTGCMGTACGTIDQAGLYTAPNLAPSPPTVTITGTPAADPTKAQSVVVTINSVVIVVVSPSTLNIEIEAQQMFTANVGGLQPPQSVTWSLSGPGCTNLGNPCGALSVGAGQVVVDTFPVTYTAPITVLPSNGIGPVTITATSVADTTKSASVTPTFFSTIQPSLLPSGATRAVNHAQTLFGSLTRTSTGTTPVNSAVSWSVNGISGGDATNGFICSVGVACSGGNKISSSGVGNLTGDVDYVAPAGVPANPAVTIEMRSQADTSKFITSLVTVVANVTVNVTPSAATLPTSGIQPFSANVTGAFNQAVTWNVAAAAGGACNEVSLVPSGAGKISCGTIDAAGIYTAPNAAPASTSPGNQVSITATSVDSPTQSGSGTLTIAAGAFISKIAPASITALGAGSIDFTLKVQGSSFLAGTPGNGSTIILGTVPPTSLSTTCASTSVCTATVSASSMTTPGDYGVQISNPPASPQPGPSNLVALKVLDPVTQVKSLDAAPSVSLTAAVPNAGCNTPPLPTDPGCQNITVVEPTTAGSLNEQYNMDQIGIITGNSCNIPGTNVALTRPNSGTQNFDICVRNSSLNGPSLSPTDTFTISGPSPNDVTIVQVQGFPIGAGIIQITLQVGSTSKTGPRTLFAENKNREKTALAGSIEVK